MKRIGKFISAFADRLLAPFLLVAFLVVPVCYHVATRPAADASLRNAVDEGNDARLDAARLDVLNAPDETGMTPLMVASMLGRRGTVERLLARGVDVNFSDPRIGTALMVAAHDGQATIVASLLRHGADATTFTASGDDALWFAVLGGDTACVTAILHAGTDPVAGARRCSPLGGVTATGDRADLVRLLVAAGVSANRPGLDGIPPLVDVAAEGAADSVRALLQLGADPAARDRRGQTARDVAAKYGRLDVVRLLDQYTPRQRRVPPAPHAGAEP